MQKPNFVSICSKAQIILRVLCSLSRRCNWYSLQVAAQATSKVRAAKEGAMATSEENSKEKEGANLLGSPTFEKLENGRFKCVETGHELLAKDKDSYSQCKRCRLGLIDYAVSHCKPPVNMFKQDPLSRYLNFITLSLSFISTFNKFMAFFI